MKYRLHRRRPSAVTNLQDVFRKYTKSVYCMFFLFYVDIFIPRVAAHFGTLLTFRNFADKNKTGKKLT